MKKIKNIIMSTAVFAAAGMSVSSCDIDLLPLNEVVYENFWTNKEDVESVVTSCYSSFLSPDYMTRLITWGELRSDNVSQGPNVGDEVKYLLKGSIKTTNSLCNWSSIYTTINYCNVVLEEAPKVAQKDPNYTESDYRINVAECKFLRAYSYFTLVKTFKEVPFTFAASMDDSQTFRLPQTAGEVIIDTLIQDIESCKDFAPNKYTDQNKSMGKITRPAMYALLADLYLWKASDANLPKAEQSENYRKCIECCDWIINFKMKIYDSNDFFEYPDIRSDIDKEVYTDYGYPLLAEERTPGTNTSGPLATKALFYDCFSFESIFEMAYYDGRSIIKVNNAIATIYGKETGKGQQVVAAEKLFDGKPESSATYTDSRLFSVPSDYRSIASFYYNEQNGGYNIYKYCISRNEAGAQGGDYGSVGTKYVPATKTQSYGSRANWIIYRLSEIMLMRAEAEIELAYNMDAAATTPDEGTGDGSSADAGDNAGETEETAGGNQRKATRVIGSHVDGSSLLTADELRDDAFHLISAVYRRSNPVVKTSPKYAPTQPTTYDGYHTLLMNERRREFLFEGKRYFDLVREARRNGNTKAFRTAMANKFADSNPAVSVKMIQMDFLYMPVLKSEMKVNPLLHQNSCYLDEEENTKN